MKISEQIEKIVFDICDKYCKYPEAAVKEHPEDPDWLNESGESPCNSCPLNNL